MCVCVCALLELTTFSKLLLFIKSARVKEYFLLKLIYYYIIITEKKVFLKD